MENNLLAFKIWGDFAHYRKIYTTTSPLTYLIPPRTTLSGLVAAIVGLEKNKYHNSFNTGNSGFGIQISGGQKKKLVIPTNLIDTKTNMYLWDCSKDAKRTQIPFEYVKNPQYCIYVWMDDQNIYQKLKQMLEKGKTYYTPSLGLSGCLAGLEYVGETKYELKDAKNPVSVKTAVDSVKNNIVLEPRLKYGRERMPLVMNEDRKVLSYGEIIYEVTGQPIKISSGTYAETTDGNITFI